jgi:hypothetical protein
VCCDPLEALKKKHQGEISVSTSIAKREGFGAGVQFFYVTSIASDWCKVLKPLHGFNLTVIWGGLFHKLINRLVENPRKGKDKNVEQ